MINSTQARISKLRKSMSKTGIPALVVTNLVNRNYLSGFTGTDCIVLITQNKSYFITDFRYTQQAKEQVKGFHIIERPTSKGALQTAIELAHDLKFKKLGFESAHLTHLEFSYLEKWGRGITFLPTQNLIENIRLIKDADELSLITKSQKLSLSAFEFAVSNIEPGITENEIALLFEEQARRLGASAVAFDTIIASGWRSALPHGVASSKKIKKGDFLTFDFGVIYNLYNSDCTRTFVIGKPTPKQKEIYYIALEAQQTALDAIKPGVYCKDIDTIARNIISKAGYGKKFGHGLGHGVGRDIHEAPRLSQSGSVILEPGMVVTVEPGIYLEGFGGVRIEDLVIVTKTGHKVLTKFPKELISLGN